MLQCFSKFELDNELEDDENDASKAEAEKEKANAKLKSEARKVIKSILEEKQLQYKEMVNLI